MSKYSPVFRKYIHEYSQRAVALALFDIITVGSGAIVNGTIVGTLIIQESIIHDKALFQLNDCVNIKETDKLEVAKRAIQFKKRIENGDLAIEIDPNKPIKIYYI